MTNIMSLWRIKDHILQREITLRLELGAAQ
jgi:hypothetical protein